MFTLLWNWICSIFTADKIGILVRKLLIRSTTIIAADILDVDNQKKAYEFVKELNNNKELSTAQKAEQFNKKMLEYALKEGKKLSTSVINCLRELAVNAIKIDKVK